MRQTVNIDLNARYRAGLVAAASGALLIVLALVVVGAPSGQEYTAEFARADGARAGSEVRVAGVTGGEISDVKLAGDRIRVTFTLDDEIHLGARTRATMKLSTLLGSYYLELRPEGSGTLKDRRIPLAQTSVSYSLDALVNATGGVTEELDGEGLREAVTTFSEAVGENGEIAGRAMTSATQLSKSIEARRGQMQAFIASVRGVSTMVRENQSDVLHLVDDSTALLRELERRREAIVGLIQRADGLSRQVNAFIERNGRPMNKALEGLSAATSVLASAKKDIDRSLQSLAPTMRYVTNLAGDGPYARVRIASVLPDNFLCLTGAVTPCS